MSTQAADEDVSAFIRGSAIGSLLSVVAIVVGLSTDHWESFAFSTNHYDVEGGAGLWWACTTDTPTSPGWNAVHRCKELDHDYLKAVAGLLIVALTVDLVSFVAWTLTECGPRKVRQSLPVYLVIYSASILGALLSTTAFIVYAANRRTYFYEKIIQSPVGIDLDWDFYIVCGAALSQWMSVGSAGKDARNRSATMSTNRHTASTRCIKQEQEQCREL